jgi:hypothetical protein
LFGQGRAVVDAHGVIITGAAEAEKGIGRRIRFGYLLEDCCPYKEKLR